MSDYTKSTNFASKDNLSSGNPLKIVKGTEIDTEFNNIQTAIATKADLTSPTFTGTPSLPTGTTGVTQTATNSSTLLATTAFVQAALQLLYPVGTIYTNSSVSTNPATLLGFGTWTAFGAGRVMVGFNSGNSLFDTAEETGGSADAITVSHTHTATSTVTDPGHNHGIGGTGSGSIAFASSVVGATDKFTGTNTTGISVSTSISTTGSSATNANYQPYITVYLWKRTA
jgi:hypothetical protein